MYIPKVEWGAARRPSLVTMAALCAALMAVGTEEARAQTAPGSTRTIAADRARVAQLTGGFATAAADSVSIGDGFAVRAIMPTVRFVWNSQLPSDHAVGPLWAGRGASASVTAGVALRRAWTGGAVELRVAPTATYSQNESFQTLPGREPGRSAFSSPWHLGIASADLPPRFGDQPLRTFGPGESELTLSARGIAIGVATSTQWWGPALRNTLVLSDNAEGIPRAFVRSATPLRTRAGLLTGHLFIGTLTESAFFDAIPGNDRRSASGLQLTYSPALDTLFTLGLSRLVIAPSASVFPIARALDVFTRREPIANPPNAVTGPSTQSTDQLISFFGRWRFPASGLETYAEWARMEFPRSVRDFLVSPQHTSGYTIGAQLVQARSRAHQLRSQVELTYLEQTQTYPDRQSPDFYTGSATVHGFTQRGQILGAEIGPGGSTQFAAVDWLAPNWHLGVFLGRARRENDAFYRQPNPLFTQHDVELNVGVRGGLRRAWGDLSGEVSIGQRRNYLFQNSFNLGGPVVANDVQNLTLSMLLSPPSLR